MHLLRRLIVCGMVVGLMSGSTSPMAQAAQAGGALSFQGTAHLSAVPCASTCSGTLAASAQGSLAGVDAQTVPWTVAFQGATIDAAFTYGESCVGLGIAQGSGTLQQGVGGEIGTYGPVAGAIAPYPVVGLSVAFTFQWQRATTLITTQVSSVTLQVAQPDGSIASLTAFSGEHDMDGTLVATPSASACLSGGAVDLTVVGAESSGPLASTTGEPGPTMTGSLSWEGSCSYPWYYLGASGWGNCIGIAAGGFTGLDDTSAPYVAVCVVACPLDAEFTYSELCVAGTASGTLYTRGFALSPDHPQVQQFEMEAPFTYLRLGDVVVVLTGGLAGGNRQVQLESGGGGVVSEARDTVGSISVGTWIDNGSIPQACLSPSYVSAEMVVPDAIAL